MSPEFLHAIQHVVHRSITDGVAAGLGHLSHLNSFQICALATYLLWQGTVFAVAPEEVVFMSMGVLWSQGRVGLPEALVACFLGLLPANSAMVFITGRFARAKMLQKPAVHRALELVKRRRKTVIAVTRFTPIVRAPVYASIGLSGMRVRDFFAIDATAALFHIPALVLLGAYIGHKTGSIKDAYKVIAIIALTVATAVGVSVFIYETKRKRQEKRSKSAGSKSVQSSHA